MKIDLFKLNNLNKLEINSDLTIDSSLFGTTGIRNIKNLHVEGLLKVQYDEVIVSYLTLKGIMTLGCALSNEDVDYEFETTVEDESLGNFNDIYDTNKYTFDLLPYIWELIVSEVPIRVVKEGAKASSVGKGWELVSSD